MKISLILTSSSEKFSPCGGPPSGWLLKRRAVSNGPLRGAELCRHLLKILLPFSTILPHFSVYPPLIKWSRKSPRIRLKKHEDIDICHQKIINFSTETTKIRKKIRLAAGPLPGVALSGEQSPAARCAGAKIRKILVNFEYFCVRF